MLKSLAVALLSLGMSVFAVADEPRGRNLSQWPFHEALLQHRLAALAGVTSRDTLCAEAPSKLPRYADALAYAEELGSYSLLVYRAGECEMAHYFAPHGENLRPESASMHKSVVALLLLAAIDDGYIDSVDDTLDTYIDAWRNDPRGAIRLRDVLSMASGLKPFSREGGRDSEAFRYLDPETDVIRWTLEPPLISEPGSRFHYGGPNTQLLLMVIEAATGQRYRDYLSDRIWKPLGNQTSFLAVYNDDRQTPKAYSALMATARDWLRVGLLLRNHGRVGDRQLISRPLLDAMTSPSPANPNYGWQLWLGTTYEPVRYYTSDGSGIGFASAEPFDVDDMIYFDGIGGQRMYLSPSEDLIIVRLGDARPDWDDTRLPNLIIRANRIQGGTADEHAGDRTH